MTVLPPLPQAPPDARYALTVPQSVMFADLSLRGSTRPVFERAVAIDYEPEYIAIDDGAMTWNFSLSDPFVEKLATTSPVDPADIARRFIELMGRTSRGLTRRARVLAQPGRRRSNDPSDVLSDLNQYWEVYEAHMTSLFTFWNVETLLSDALVDALRADGADSELEAGLPTFVRPSEPNWFALEQANLLALKQRFGAEQSGDGQAAAEGHALQFGFLLAPFNLGEPPSGEMVIERIAELRSAAAPHDQYKSLSEWSPLVQELGDLERQLTFWKTERLDAFALADSLLVGAYGEAAALLGVDLETVYRMTRNELAGALSGSPPDLESVGARGDGFCLAFVDGSIGFYEPTSHDPAEESEVVKSGTVLRGTVASPGVVVGRVRIVQPGEQPSLEDDEVLVTQMTRPDMGAALDQAIAYVTDEGGRLCHAAIVSREKGKPCVIAVGNATRLLRQGMLVEVDGADGTVTVLDASFLSDHT